MIPMIMSKVIGSQISQIELESDLFNFYAYDFNLINLLKYYSTHCF
jgi:hypothetical protein